MAKNLHDFESKSLKPEGLEDKSLAPDTEHKAVGAPDETEEPAQQPAPVASPADGVRVVFAHPVSKGRIGNDEAIRAGDERTISKVLAARLVPQGVVRIAD